MAQNTDAELAEALDRYLAAERDVYAPTIAELYPGGLPEWVPEPAVVRVQQAVLSLRAANQSVERIVKVVAQAAEHTPDIPADVLDHTSFYVSANYLAHVQRALSLGKARAIEELGGRSAALGEKTRDQRRTFSTLGNSTKKTVAADKARKWFAIGKPLREKHPEKPDTWLATQIARACGDKAGTIRSAIKKLGLSKRNT